MELVGTWWPAALAGLACLVLAMVVAAVTATVFDDEVSAGCGAEMAVLLLMIGAPIAAVILVGPSPDPFTALVGVLAVVAGLGVYFVFLACLADRYLGPAWNGTRTRSRVWVAAALSVGAAIAATLVLGWWLPTVLGMTGALAVTSAAVLAELGLIALAS